MSNVLIVGFGVVGHNLYKELVSLHPDVYDKYKTENNTKRNIQYDIAFICTDTPRTEEAKCDISSVKAAINETDAKIYVIKSTVLPGTTLSLIESTGKNIVFSPEYYGGTQHCNNFDFAFTILGGYVPHCKMVQQVLQNVYDARHRFVWTSSTTAELAKYMENSYLGTMVSFCVQFYELAQFYVVDYEELRELFILDPRVNPSHTFVYEDHPYWQSHCLDKDIPAIAEDSGAEFLRALIKYNDHCKEKA